jgi:hypothetical protein
VDIGSRQKRRNFMRENGLADYADFREHWQNKAKERARPAFKGDLRADIARNYETLSRGRK